MKNTIENLVKAFIGESQARNRYTFYAKTAKNEGLVQTAEIFLVTAENEKEHARDHFKLLGGVGDTAANLEAAISGEHYETVEMYPQFAKEAEEEGNMEAAILFKMIGKILIGDVSVKNLSGPINIAVYAGYSAGAGFARFMDFLAIVSISLGVLNLLPIPILDGGHLMYYVVETVKGSPVSDAAMEIGQRIGIALLILLMTVAFYNDILRLLN